MYQVFNMGHRFEIYASRESADGIIAQAKEYGIDAQKIGYCKASSGKKLSLHTEHGTFEY
jgi:phosphoribosylformylglycinamidine cyclo-ligase